MSPISIKIVCDEGAVTRKVKFDNKVSVRDALAIVKDKVIVPDPNKAYGLFLRSPDNEKAGIWLEAHRTLDYYMLRDGDSLDYICKIRNLRIKLLDESVKTLQVDEGKTVSELMENICGRLGITNYDEYGLVCDEEEKCEEVKEQPSTGTLTLKRAKAPPKDRDVALEQLSKKLNTDDNVVWLDQHRTLRELGVDATTTVTLKRRLFFSDRNVDARDPVQLNLLYLQTRDAILSARHLVTEDQATEFAGIQCQIQFGDFQEEKHKPGFIENLNEYLPETYSGAWGIEKKLLKAFRKHQGQAPLDAKVLYVKTARALPTYGVTFFLVKEKQKDKKKLVPRLLGINAEAILRLDEKTKEILQQWPLTHVKTYHVGKSETFTLNFGDYSDKEYCCKTQHAYRIREILEGYIDIIRRRMLARPAPAAGDSMAVCHDNVQTGQSQLIQHVNHQPSKLVTETFVGPNKIVPMEQGSTAQHGTSVMTMQQIIQSNQFNNPQKALRGEVAERGDMSMDCVRKLKRMNSNSVKVVTLLTEPSEANLTETNKLVGCMQEDLVFVEMGVKSTIQQQTIEESKKMLQNEMQDLTNYMNKLSDSLKPGKVDTSEAKDAAEKIVDLTTEMYFSHDPKSRRNSEMLNRSKKSFIAGEKMDDSIHRASFLTASHAALASVGAAARTVAEEYPGPAVEESRALLVQQALAARLGKLNAALALYLTAHSDPNNIDYSAATTSMNTINELMPKLTQEAQQVLSTKDPVTAAELRRDLQALCQGAQGLCALAGTDDHEKMQEACNNYADVAGKLIFTFARGKNADKENEIIELAKEAGKKTSVLLVSANELPPATPGARGAVDAAGVRAANAARDLLACAQLSAPAIQEPHCQSAVSAAAAALTSSVQQLAAAYKPQLDAPAHRHLADKLHAQEMDVHKALDKLKEAYANLNAAEDESLPLKERQRLKFTCSLAGARNNFHDLPYTWGKQAGEGGAGSAADGGVLLELKQKAARRRLADLLPQLNAAVAELARATHDPDRPDYATAETALQTISELMPTIVQDMEAVSAGQDASTRGAMQQHVTALCHAVQDMLHCMEQGQGAGPAAEKFSAAASKLVFLTSPGADKGKEKTIKELSHRARDDTAALLASVPELPADADGRSAADLQDKAQAADRAADALVTIAQLTAASMSEARCAGAMTSALEELQARGRDVTAAGLQHLPRADQRCEDLKDSHQRLENTLQNLADVCQLEFRGTDTVDPALAAAEERKRLQFIKSVSGAKDKLDAADQHMKEPLGCIMMKQEDGVVLQKKLSDQLAQLNASVAGLAAASADRSRPDYEAAQKAVDAIAELLPPFVEEACVVGALKSGSAQSSMQQQLRRLCDAARALCQAAPDTQGVNEAAAKYSDAAGKLVYLLSPAADRAREKEIMELSSASCGRASELSSVLESLAPRADPRTCAELHAQLASAGDAARALHTAAQVTAPTINHPQCSKALISAAERVRNSTQEAITSISPYLTAAQQEQQQLQAARQQLHDALDQLVRACNQKPTKPPVPVKQDKQRVQFVRSLSAAKGCFNDAHAQLQQPVVCEALQQQEAVVLQQRLGARLAQLNAAIAALATATADRDHPDYASAQRAVNTITTLTPLLVQDSKKLCGSMDGPAQQQLLQQVQQLCAASEAVCDGLGQPQGISDAAAKFSKASSKLMFTLSPAADDARNKQILEASSAAYASTSKLLSQAQAARSQLPAHSAAELAARSANTADAAKALVTVAQVTAASSTSPQCRAELQSAARSLQAAARALCGGCTPHVAADTQQQLHDSRQQLEYNLNKLLQACSDAHDGAGVLSPELKEKQRLQFTTSLAGAKNCFDDAQQMLKQPVAHVLLPQEGVRALQQQLGERIAQLNAAVAHLVHATADRDHPDYATAQRAVDTITTLTPLLVQDAQTLSATMDEPAQQDMLQQVQQLCDASRAVCDNVGEPQGLNDAAVQFIVASGDLMSRVAPAEEQDKLLEEEIINLSTASCMNTSELLSQVEALKQQLDGSAATELDQLGAKTADAAQTLLSVAQVTAPSISSPQCQAALQSAVQSLRGSAAELGRGWSAHVTSPAQRQQLQHSHSALNDSLDKLLLAVKGQQDRQRQQLTDTLSAANSCFDGAKQQLKQPVEQILLLQEEIGSLQHQLSDRIAQLNAAVARLAAATADRDHPDYASAQLAVNTITSLMPQLVHDAKTLSATKEGAAQKDLLQKVQRVCDASRAVCDSTVLPQDMNKAAATFSTATSELMTSVAPAGGHDTQTEKQIIDLSSASYARTSELLAKVQELTKQLDESTAAELDQRGARTADAAQALVSVAQVTAPSMSSPPCQAALQSATQALRGSAGDLTSASLPHTQSTQQHQLITTQKQLDCDLDKLLQVCKGAEQEKQRLRFVNSVSEAKSCFGAATHQLKQPVVHAPLHAEQVCSLQHELADRLALLNAAIAALTEATADRDHPDYAIAQRAVDTITTLMPLLVQDSRTLSASMDEPARKAMLQQVQQLCDASNALCDNVGETQGVTESAAKLSAASSQLMTSVTPAGGHHAQTEKQIIALSSASCAVTSELLSQVQALTQQLDGSAATELDQCGAKTADAAQTLLTVAQVTAPSMNSPQCQAALQSAVQSLRGSAAELGRGWSAHVTSPAQRQQLQHSHSALNDSLDKLLLAVKGQQDKQRQQLTDTLSAANSCFDEAQQQLKQPVQQTKLPQEQLVSLQHQLSDRIARLNAAVARLAAATADRDHPDYASAQRAVNTITTLMPLLVQDAKTLSSTFGPTQKDMLQQIQQLCDASKDICDKAQDPKGLNDAAAKFTAASSTTLAAVGSALDYAREKQIIDLTTSSCGRTSELLSHVQALRSRVPEDAALALDARGARTADAARALLTTAQVTAPSMSSPQCQSALQSAAQSLRGSAAQLARACRPLAAPAHAAQIASTHQQLDNNLETLLRACQTGFYGALSPAQQRDVRIKFVRVVASASGHLEDTEKQLKQPQTYPARTQSKAEALQQQLSRRLAHLNVAIAALTAATTDHKNPDYASAERSIITITELMPKVVQESKALSSTKDEGTQKAIHQHLEQLYEASRKICDNADDPKKLNESAAKFADASTNLITLVAPGDVGTAPGLKKKGPAVPVRSASKPAVAGRPAPSAQHGAHAQDFLDALRADEANSRASGQAQNPRAAEEAKLKQQYLRAVDTADGELQCVQDSLKEVLSGGAAGAGAVIVPLELAAREQRLQDTLAAAAVHVAHIVAANYADNLDYKAALQPTVDVTKAVTNIVEDGTRISSTMSDEARRRFLSDMLGLCDASRNICHAAKTNNEKLNEAAVTFSGQSVKLLQVVSNDVNPTLEREVISLARDIGDSASRLAQEVSSAANSASAPGAEHSRVQDACAAGALCVDAAGKLVYAAKLVAPTINDAACKETLIASAENLSSKLATFADTWKPLASDPQTSKLTEEARNLENLLEKLKGELKSGSLGKRRAVDRQVLVDTPLRQLTVQIIDNAREMAEHGELQAQAKDEYREYCNGLIEALSKLDYATVRCQRAPHDQNRRNEMEIAIQDLQMMALQMRPARAGQEVNNIVDFRDFLQGLSTECDQLSKTADRTQAVTGKRVADDIKLLCTKISEDSTKLLNPTQHADDESFDDIMDIYDFGQECDHLVKELNSMIRGVPDQKARSALKAKLLPVSENCHLLRFATNAAVSTARSLAYDEALQELDHFRDHVLPDLLKIHAERPASTELQTEKLQRALGVPCQVRGEAERALACGAARAAAGRPQALRHSLVRYTVTALHDVEPDCTQMFMRNVRSLTSAVKEYTEASSVDNSNWMQCESYSIAVPIVKAINDLQSLEKVQFKVLKEEDTEILLTCPLQKVEGTRTQLEEKFHQQSSQLTSLSGSVLQSVSAPAAGARSLHAAAGAAAALANTARALKDAKKPVQSKKIEEAAHEMCLATYSLLKTSELLCQSSNHQNTRKKLLDACYQLNEAITRLNRTVFPEQKISRECNDHLRALQLQRSVLQAPLQPAAASPYAHCVDALHSQRDVLLKLNSDEAMTREQFLQSLLFTVTAVCNTTECSAQAAYLLSVSGSHKSVALEGAADAAGALGGVGAVHDACVRILLDRSENVIEEKRILEKQVEELLKDLEVCAEKTQDQDLKQALNTCRKDVSFSSKALCNAIQEKKSPDVIASLSLRLSSDARCVSAALLAPAPAHAPGPLPPHVQDQCDDVIKHSTALLSNTQELVKEIKLSPEQTAVIKWTTFTKRREVLAAFDALLKSIKSNGQKVNILEDDSEQKSYVQIQCDTAFKWLHKPMAKSDVKANGQQAVRNLIDVGKQLSEELDGADREELRHVLDETEQLLALCCKKYDQEQYSLLMDRVRELQKAVERAAVTRVVEDFIMADQPLQDLDILADAERDPVARQFLLERKIAELLAQLARVRSTARLVARTGAVEPQRAKELTTCSEQTDLLAPMLVKAAEERIQKSDDQAAIEKYQSLLAQYTASLAHVRELCDRAVEPMEFVQAAADTMQRLRDDAAAQDPLSCAQTSAAITKLANRVIHVGLSSSSARDDPELQRALQSAQQQLTAATPAPDTRASKLPDWKDTTAMMLRATGEVESYLGGEGIFKQQPDTNQPIYNEALNLHVAIREWSSRDNEIVAVAKRMAVLMAKLSGYMNADKQHEVLTTSKSIVSESHEVARLAKKLAHECSDHRIKTNLLQVCERIPTISGQLKMLTTVKGSALGQQGSHEDKEAMAMLVGNAQSLMISIQDVVKAAASASVKIMSQRGPKIKWVRKTYY